MHIFDNFFAGCRLFYILHFLIVGKCYFCKGHLNFTERKQLFLKHVLDFELQFKRGAISNWLEGLWAENEVQWYLAKGLEERWEHLVASYNLECS